MTRVVVVAADRTLANQLVADLPNAEIYATLDAANLANDDLCVWCSSNELLARAPLLPCPTIVMLANADLTAAVAVMQRSNRIVAVVRDRTAVAALARRVLGDEKGGIERVLAAGTPIHTEVVSDFTDKARCLALIAGVAKASGLDQIESVEQCVDEMLMNALYDAPVDADGAHVFAEITARARTRMRTSESVTVQYGFDGARFAIRVRDAFGSIDRETILKFLHKSLHASEPVDRRAGGGAGLGLYLVASAASAVLFEIVPGAITGVTCMFDVEHRQLSQLGVITYSSLGRAPTRPARRRLDGRHRARRFAVGASTVLFVAGLVLRHRAHTAPARITVTTTNGATIALEGKVIGTAPAGTLSIDDLDVDRTYRVSARLDGFESRRTLVRLSRGANDVALELSAVATVELESTPTAAAVTVDGKPMGTTPLRLELPPESNPTISFDYPGFRTVSTPLAVPARGRSRQFVENLERSNELVRVHVTSKPPGAAIVRGMQELTADRTYTPADVYVRRNEAQSVTLIMPKHTTLVIPSFTATTEATLEKSGDLEALP